MPHSVCGPEVEHLTRWLTTLLGDPPGQGE
jgi:phospholipase/carboxylesterase